MRLPILILMVLSLALKFGKAHASRVDLEEWHSYKIKYNKTFENEAEETFRSMIYLDNLRKIANHNSKFNAGHVSYKLGINQFSDQLHSEWKATRLATNITLAHTRVKGCHNHIGKAEDEVDWVRAGAVTQVKDQGRCSSSWAFSAIGAVEGLNFIVNSKLVPLSVQHLVDCGLGDRSGCSSGSVDTAFQYITDNKGVNTEEAYPYQGQYQYYCGPQPDNVGAITGYLDLPEGDEECLQESVGFMGPISASIDASQESFKCYGGGIYDEPNCDRYNLDHNVLIVGYGSEDNQDFWLVKNSWGDQWGEKGYIRMARNKESQCGIATAASYPFI